MHAPKFHPFLVLWSVFDLKKNIRDFGISYIQLAADKYSLPTAKQYLGTCAGFIYSTGKISVYQTRLLYFYIRILLRPRLRSYSSYKFVRFYRILQLNI